MDGHHWRVTGIRDFALFFRALPLLASADSLLAIAEGAWPLEVRETLQSLDRGPGTPIAQLPSEFLKAFWIPVSEHSMETLARLSDRHAEPEIGMFFGLFTPERSVLEWFDAPDDPVSVTPGAEEPVVAAFASAAQGKYESSTGS